MKDEGEKKERKKIARDSFCAMKFSQEDGVREKGGKKNLSNQFGYQFEECWIYICRGV